MTAAEWLDAGKWALDWGLRAVPVVVLVQQFRNRATIMDAKNVAVAVGRNVEIVKDHVAIVKADIAEVKKETNHMKDALVAAEKSVSFTAGASEQRDAGRGVVVTAPPPAV